MIVAALLVTYGSRWEYLHRVLAKLRSDPNISGVIVVDNASSVSVAKLVEQHGLRSFVDVISNKRNVGSAKAFAQGLARLIEGGRYTHVYMLDDDNEPQEEAISELVALQNAHGNRSAQLSLRRDRVEFAQAEKDGRAVRHVRDSFLGYEIVGAVRKRIPGRTQSVETSRKSRAVDVEYAPYGGLFLPLAIVKEVGLPEEDFVLYVDDHEFTTRITRAGVQIRLCLDSVVEDLEKSWHLAKNKRNVPPLFAESSSDFRIYYSVRNRVAFEREYLIRSRPRYMLNVVSVLVIQSLKALLAGASVGQIFRRFKLICRAWSDGWNRRLGICANFQLG